MACLADLSDRLLVGAKLQSALLRGANLQGTVLMGANLQGACGEIQTLLKDEQLAKARMLHGTIMPDGRRYDGRLKLADDISSAQLEGIDINSPEAMARWYASPPNPGNVVRHLIKLWQKQHPDAVWSPERISELLDIASNNSDEQNSNYPTDEPDNKAVHTAPMSSPPFFILSGLAVIAIIVVFVAFKKRR